MTRLTRFVTRMTRFVCVIPALKTSLSHRRGNLVQAMVSVALQGSSSETTRLGGNYLRMNA